MSVMAVGSMAHGVLTISFVGIPPQVIDMVVGSIAIVVATFLSRRTRSIKCLQYRPMYKHNFTRFSATPI